MVGGCQRNTRLLCLSDPDRWICLERNWHSYLSKYSDSLSDSKKKRTCMAAMTTRLRRHTGSCDFPESSNKDPCLRVHLKTKTLSRQENDFWELKNWKDYFCIFLMRQYGIKCYFSFPSVVVAIEFQVHFNSFWRAVLSSGKESPKCTFAVPWRYQNAANEVTFSFDTCQSKSRGPLCFPWLQQRLHALPSSAKSVHFVERANFTNEKKFLASVASHVGRFLLDVLATGQGSGRQNVRTFRFFFRVALRKDRK